MYNEVTYNEVVNDDSFTLQTLLEYIRENFYGLLLLVFAFYIIYIVDYISHINTLIFAMSSPIPGVSSTLNNIAITKTNKSRKIKKR